MWHENQLPAVTVTAARGLLSIQGRQDYQLLTAALLLCALVSHLLQCTPLKTVMDDFDTATVEDGDS